ncbi:hypothetical protein [Pampinifervens florentissimum]|uniref:hypothetical protein n=1 Tax=Pampinifervens florentissimum TaxID=1632019 RepID=UPI0013B49878|nr:hypothetical protein [Hydrogenobacter sp. T-8]QID33321.1 hypothetical protein G3M65_05885 [Hydrogenobacter sp. T-8]
MIDRVDIQRIIGYIAELEERKRRQVQEKEESQGVSVELSQRLQKGGVVNYEDISKKVESIRSQMQKNAYEVSPERILQGLEKFLSSK